MSLPALLLLTLMADGGTRLTLSPAESAEACEATREVLVQVLTEAGKLAGGNPAAWVVVDFPEAWQKMGPALLPNAAPASCS